MTSRFLGHAKRLTATTWLTALLLGLPLIGCPTAHARAYGENGNQPQLYLALISGSTFVKGHLDETNPQKGKKRMFRECFKKKSILVDSEALVKISGDCKDPNNNWPQASSFIGRVVNVKRNGMIQLKTDKDKTLSWSADDWKKGFLSNSSTSKLNQPSTNKPPSPKVGDFIGGFDQKEPKYLYVIKKASGL